MKKLLLSSVGLMSVLSPAAFAQTPATSAPNTDSAAQSADDNAIADIVVTAQRRSERLQDVPVAVTAVTGDRLAAVGIQSSQDLSAVTPGLSIPQTAGYTQPRIRGVGTSSNGPGVENPVATYIDGVYIASAPSSLLTLNNIQRVEVLKGPQGTLFGRNATGGLIQIVTKDPSHNLGGAANVSYGNYKMITADAYVTGGLSDALSADVAMRYEHQSGGFGTNLFNGKPVGTLDHDFAGRVKFLFEPSNRTQVRLSLDYEDRDSDRDIQHLDTSQQPASPYNNAEFGGPFAEGGFYDVNANYPYRNKLKAGGGALQVNQELGSVDLQSITAYRKSEYIFNLDLDQLPFNGFIANSKAKFDQFSQELQFSSKGSGPLKWVAGLYYFHSKDGWQPLEIGIGPSVAGVQLNLITQDYEKTDAVAGYAQATYEILSDTNLTLGGRYNYEHKTVSGSVTTKVFGTTVATEPFPRSPVVTKATYKRFNYRIALDHKFTPDILGYVSYNTGFKSGGFVLAKVDADPFQPEDIRAAEVGLKTQLFDRHVRLNLAGFHYNYKNIQVQRFVAGNNLIYNGAKAEMYGLDVDGEIVVGNGLSLNGGLSYVHNEFKSFPLADRTAPGGNCPNVVIAPGGVVPCEAAGNKLPQTPTFSFNIGGDYSVSTDIGTFALNATYYRQSRVFAAADNVAFQKAYGLINASLSWTDKADHISVKLWGKNLGQTHYRTSLIEAGTGLEVANGYPRTYGVTAGFMF